MPRRAASAGASAGWPRRSMDRAATFRGLLQAKREALADLERATAQALADVEALGERAASFLAHRQEILDRVQEIDAALAGFGPWWDAGALGLAPAERDAAARIVGEGRAAVARILEADRRLADWAAEALKTARESLSRVRRGREAVSRYRPYGSRAPRFVAREG